MKAVLISIKPKWVEKIANEKEVILSLYNKKWEKVLTFSFFCGKVLKKYLLCKE